MYWHNEHFLRENDSIEQRSYRIEEKFQKNLKFGCNQFWQSLKDAWKHTWWIWKGSQKRSINDWENGCLNSRKTLKICFIEVNAVILIMWAILKTEQQTGVSDWVLRIDGVTTDLSVQQIENRNERQVPKTVKIDTVRNVKYW